MGPNLGADVTRASRYTGPELGVLAAREGLVATPRLLRRWVQLGLLDQPDRVGLGRGRGIRATWSANQARLLLELLKAQARSGTIAGLCHLPVWLWLRWGDDYVPLRQVRRALSTWRNFATNPSWAGAGRTASVVVAAISAPETRRSVRKRLREVVADQATGGFNRAELLRAARDAVDGKKSPRGPEAAPLDAQTYVRLVAARFDALGRLADVSDAEFDGAREAYRLGNAVYNREQADLAANHDTGHLFGVRGPEEEIRDACMDLVTLLGMSRAPEVES